MAMEIKTYQILTINLPFIKNTTKNYALDGHNFLIINKLESKIFLFFTNTIA